MSNNCGNLDNPVDLELNFDDNSIVEFLEKNLGQLLVNTAHMKVELEVLQEQKKQLLRNHRHCCLANVPLELFPEDMDLLPRLNQVTSKAKELMGHLTKLVDARAKVKMTNEQHYEDAKDATMITLKSSFDQCTIKPTDGQDKTKIIDGKNKAMEKTVAKTAAKKTGNEKGECHATSFDMMHEINLLTRMQKDSIKTLEQIRLMEALSKGKPSQ